MGTRRGYQSHSRPVINRNSRRSANPRPRKHYGKEVNLISIHLRQKLLLLVGLCTICSVAAAQSSPTSTVRAALVYEQEPEKVDNVIFNRRNIDIRKKWITRDLYDLYLVELA